MRLRIAIVAQAHTPVAEPFAGGLEAHTHALASQLSARGHHVTVHAAATPGTHPFDVRAMRPVQRSQGRADLCESPAAARSEALAYLDTMAELVTGSYDIVHLNTTHFSPFACAAALPVPVTGTLHCPPYEQLANVLRVRCDVSLATVSNANARSWQRHVSIDRVLGNGIDLDRWRAGPGGGGAVWVGRLVPEKAPDLAIAAARLAGMRLRLVGPIHDRRYFHDHIEPHLGNGISHIGHLPTTALAEVVGSADVVTVTPAWDEPFGLVVAEALACGTPVAAIGRGAVRDLITEEVGVVVDNEDPQRLATAMRAAVQLDRGACRSHAVSHFDLEGMVDRYEAWFASVAREPLEPTTPRQATRRPTSSPTTRPNAQRPVAASR